MLLDPLVVLLEPLVIPLEPLVMPLEPVVVPLEPLVVDLLRTCPSLPESAGSRLVRRLTPVRESGSMADRNSRTVPVLLEPVDVPLVWLKSVCQPIEETTMVEHGVSVCKEKVFFYFRKKAKHSTTQGKNSTNWK